MSITKETGPPENVERQAGIGCPSCGSEWVYLVTAPIVNSALKSFLGTSNHLGCPACGWRSQAMAAGMPLCTKKSMLDNVDKRLERLKEYDRQLRDLRVKIDQELAGGSD